MRDPDPLSTYRYHGLLFQCVAIPFDDFGHQCYALCGRDVRQPEQAGVRLVVQVNQLTEVGIYRNQDPVCRFRQYQQGPVSRVGAQGPRFNHIVSPSSEPLSQPATGAPVYEEPHGAATETAARVSPAITVWA